MKSPVSNLGLGLVYITLTLFISSFSPSPLSPPSLLLSLILFLTFLLPTLLLSRCALIPLLSSKLILQDLALLSSPLSMLQQIETHSMHYLLGDVLPAMLCALESCLSND